MKVNEQQTGSEWWKTFYIGHTKPKARAKATQEAKDKIRGKSYRKETATKEAKIKAKRGGSSLSLVEC